MVEEQNVPLLKYFYHVIQSHLRSVGEPTQRGTNPPCLGKTCWRRPLPKRTARSNKIWTNPSDTWQTVISCNRWKKWRRICFDMFLLFDFDFDIMPWFTTEITTSPGGRDFMELLPPLRLSQRWWPWWKKTNCNKHKEELIPPPVTLTFHIWDKRRFIYLFFLF